MNIQQALQQLVYGERSLSRDADARGDDDGHDWRSDARTNRCALLVALRIRGETIEEITGAAEVMREPGDSLLYQSGLLVDLVGTGWRRRQLIQRLYSCDLCGGRGRWSRRQARQSLGLESSGNFRRIRPSVQSCLDPRTNCAMH